MAQIVNPVRPDEIYAMTGEKFRYVVRDMGDWNMDNVQFLNVAHGLGFKTIIGVKGWIRNDADDKRYLISYTKDHYFMDDLGADRVDVDGTSVHIAEINATNINLIIEQNGFFDNVNFDAVAYNRGKLIIMYED